MVKPEAAFQLAPVAILRAAAWPIEHLDGFGDPRLANLALQASPGDQSTWQPYVTTYHQVLEQERDLLWQRTAADPRFMKALLLSSPIVATRVQHLAPLRSQGRCKRMRRLENTLYRYLARAVGRSTPNGLWAGVSTVTWAETFQQQPIPTAYAFSPDLRLFQTLLRRLGQRSPYRQQSLWRINPTLTQAEGYWRFWAPTLQGQVEQREMASHPLVDILLPLLMPIEPGTLAKLCETIMVTPGWRRRFELRSISAETLSQLLETLAEGGVLLGGLDLPTQFATPWEALTQAAESLTAADRAAWTQTTESLHHLCQELSANLDTMTLGALEQALQQAAHWVEKLAQTWDIALPDLPQPLLHCDLHLPFQIQFDRDQQQALLHTLAAYESCWIQSASPATAVRLRQRQQLLQILQAERTIAPHQPRQARSPNLTNWINTVAQTVPEVLDWLRHWEEQLATPASAVTLSSQPDSLIVALPMSPLGCLFTGLGENFQRLVQGMSDDATRTVARFSPLLEAPSLWTWLQTQLRTLEHQHGITIAELYTNFASNPNVLARPDLNLLPIDLWGASSVSLQGAEIQLDPTTDLPFLKLPSQPKPIALFWFASANIMGGDLIAKRLLWTGFETSPTAMFRAASLPLPSELHTPRFSPRLQLPDGAIVRPRRTVLNQAQVQQLRQLSAPERYVHWQQLAAKQGWSDRVSVQVEGEVPLLLPHTSPLALEALFKGVREQTQWLLVEESVGLPWLTDADDRHYTAELALPFARTQHGWSCLPPHETPDHAAKTQ